MADQQRFDFVLSVLGDLANSSEVSIDKRKFYMLGANPPLRQECVEAIAMLSRYRANVITAFDLQEVIRTYASPWLDLQKRMAEGIERLVIATEKKKAKARR